MHMRKIVILTVISLSAAGAADWLSFGRDPQRTSWSPQETDINRDNVKSMTLLWKTHLDNEARELNAALRLDMAAAKIAAMSKPEMPCGI